MITVVQYTIETRGGQVLGALAHPEVRVVFIAACRVVRRRSHARAAVFATRRPLGHGDVREGFVAESIEIPGAPGSELPDVSAVRAF